MNFDDILKPIFIEGILTIKDWCELSESYYLKSIFSMVGFKDINEKDKDYFVPPMFLSSKITYPKSDDIESFDEIRKEYLMKIAYNYHGFSEDYLKKLNTNQLFFLLEKFGCNIPMDDKGETSIFDTYKIQAAKAVINQNNQSMGHKDSFLLNIDLSGIQKFIYNITSTGALKNLRSRSFFIELLCYHIIDRVLEAFNLHSVNVLMNGGGNIYILSSRPENYLQIIDDIDYNINKWLLKEFNGLLHASFSTFECSIEQLDSELNKLLYELSKRIFEKKQNKFRLLIERDEFTWVEDKDPSSYHCDICQRDEKEAKLKKNEGEDGFRCELCGRLARLGNKIPDTRYIYEHSDKTKNSLSIENRHYLLSVDEIKNSSYKWVIFEDMDNFEIKLANSETAIFAKTYARKIADLPEKLYLEIDKRKKELKKELALEHDEEQKQVIKEEINSLEDENIAMMEHLAESSKGAKFIAALRMDADNMGKLMHEGFYGNLTLEKLACFSRNVNYFFKFYLNGLCERANEKELSGNVDNAQLKGKNVHVVYSGGDDLFILGAWSDTAELAISIGEEFKKYTCNNIDLGISGGLTIHNARFPVNKMANISMKALQTAKGNLEACWMCRKDWPSCPIYTHGKCLRKNSFAPFFSEFNAFRKKKLDDKLRKKYSGEESRLELALKWQKYDAKMEKTIFEVKDFIKSPLNIFMQYEQAGLSRVFFHNVLSLLDSWYDDGLLYLPKIVWVLQKFKRELERKRERDSKKSLYDLYDISLHFFDNKKFATLHIPLSWIIFLTREGGKRDAA